MKELVLEGFRMNKKYELLRDDSIIENNTELYRIRALRSFGKVKEGDLGGYIESESNLSHEGNCWVYDDVKVYGKDCICGDTMLYNKDWLSIFDLEKGRIVRIDGKAQVCDSNILYHDKKDQTEVKPFNTL